MSKVTYQIEKETLSDWKVYCFDEGGNGYKWATIAKFNGGKDFIVTWFYHDGEIADTAKVGSLKFAKDLATGGIYKMKRGTAK